MKRLQFWPGDMKKWYNRPLLCVFGFHVLRDHPGDHTWQVCSRCDGEGQK